MAINKVLNKAGKIRFQISFYYFDKNGVKQRYRKYALGTNKTAAINEENTIRNNIARGVFPGEIKNTPRPPNMPSFAKDWLSLYVKVNSKPSYYETMKSIVDNHIIPFFGKKKLDDIKTIHVEKFKQRLIQRGLKARSINTYLKALSSIFSVAVQWEQIKVAPNIKMLKPPPQEFDFLSPGDINTLIVGCETIGDFELKRMILTAIHTGLRIGELCALQWDCIDFERSSLTVKRSLSYNEIQPPKNNKSREIPLNDIAIMAIKEQRHLKSQFVFCDDNGNHYTITRKNTALNQALRVVDMRHIHWHVFRHTFASLLILNGANLRSVQALMGHSNINETMRYSHLSHDINRDAVRRLQNIG